MTPALMDCIYLDNNATTPLLPEVWEAMTAVAVDAPGNPASSHRAGRRARQALEDAREQVAALLQAHPEEVVFTSGGTEANNLALVGLAGTPPAHLVASPVEHPSITEPLIRLKETGFVVDLLPVEPTGVVLAETMKEHLRPETRLVTVQLANNETGAIQPVAEMAAMGEGRIAFHCDAVQAVGRMPVRFADLGVTTLSLSAHKFHGPCGVGVLLIRRGTRLAPLLRGGHQQRGRRPGTEPVALAVGLTKALTMADREGDARWERVRGLRQRFLLALSAQAAPISLNGPPESGLPHTINVSFPGCRAELLVMSLDLAGVACSTGSACSSGSLLPSPVLRAMKLEEDRLTSAVRFSLSALLTEQEVEEAARRIGRAVTQLRRPTDP